MALHTCPSCRGAGFSWHLDGEAQPFVEDGAAESTWWVCSSCGYEAQEDEGRARPCRRCDDGEELWLVDRDRAAVWWCFRCRAVTRDTETGA